MANASGSEKALESNLKHKGKGISESYGQSDRMQGF
jgi:hypothetical protein